MELYLYIVLSIEQETRLFDVVKSKFADVYLLLEMFMDNGNV